MATNELDRDTIFLLLALTESARALHAIEEVERLAGLKVEVQPGVERHELQSVFDHLRLALQFSSNVSKIFWPRPNPRAGKDHGRKVTDRGARLRMLTGLTEDHPLADRSLRNHIEHMDERLDDWTADSPRPFVSIEMLLHREYGRELRDNILSTSPIVFDEESKTVILFGKEFSLIDLRASVLDVQNICSSTLSRTVKGRTQSEDEPALAP